MSRQKSNPVDDLRGIGKLAADATTGLADLVEAMHRTVSPVQVLLPAAEPGRTHGLTGAVYRGIRGAARLAGRGVDLILAQLAPLLQSRDDGAIPSPLKDSVQAALNGVLGDYLVASGNPLAIPMQCRSGGIALDLQPGALRKRLPHASGKIALLAHGLCMSDLQWHRHQHDHGVALARDLNFTPVYLRYNTGLHTSTNGRLLADLLESLIKAWPVPVTQIALIGHSMGGLVVRAACHTAERVDMAWRKLPTSLIFLGTPHHGAPLERGGAWLQNVLDNAPLIAPFARLGRLRSAGITDLRYGNVVDEDWQRADRFARSADKRVLTPLPAGMACYAIAASTAARAGTLKDRLLGDGLVPLASALGRHPQARRSLRFGKSNQWIGYRLNHLDLLGRADVYRQMARWLGAPAD